MDTQGASWSWCQCRDCGTFSLLPRPTEEDLRRAYDEPYYGKTHAKFVGWTEAFLSWCRRQRARRIARLLVPGARVLDVGCGSGEFLAKLSQFGAFELWGSELNGPAADRAARFPLIRLRRGPFEASAYEPCSFDMITLYHVFEHLSAPVDRLSDLRGLLKPNGRLVLSFPNIDSWQARIFKGDWLHLDPPRHLFLMPPSTFEKAVAATGFEVEHRSFFSIEQNPFACIQSLLNRLGFPRDLLYERLKGNSTYAADLGPLVVGMQKGFAGICVLPLILLDAIESFAFAKGATVQYCLRRKV